jgi:hypothetical protein
MTAYTTYSNGDPVVRSGGSNTASFPMRHTIENTFDATRRNMVAMDTMELMVIPPNTVVESVFYEVLAAEVTATPTIDIGDSDSGTRFFTGAATDTKGAKGYVAMTANNWHAAGNKVVLTIPALGVTPATTLKLRVVLAVTSFG